METAIVTLADLSRMHGWPAATVYGIAKELGLKTSGHPRAIDNSDIPAIIARMAKVARQPFRNRDRNHKKTAVRSSVSMEWLRHQLEQVQAAMEELKIEGILIPRPPERITIDRVVQETL